MKYFNLYGPINTLGYGVITRGLIQGLYNTNFNQFYLSIIGNRVDIEDKSEVEKLTQHTKSFLWSRKDPAVAIWHEFDLNKFSADKLVAFPIFETTSFDVSAKNYLSQMNAVFVLSSWAKEVVHNNIGNSTPVYVIPAAANIIKTKEIDERVRNSNAFTFLFVGKYELRKSPNEILQAYIKAFSSKKSDTRLLLHCYNPFDQHFKQNISKILEEQGFRLIQSTNQACIVGMHGNCIVEVPIGRIPSEQVCELYKHAHVGLFPSKGEGWNLPLMEAIQSGLPCIATDYSAHTEYLTEDNGYNQNLLLKNYTMQTAFDGVYFKGDRGLWAAPNVDELAEKMLYAHDNYSQIENSIDFEKIRQKYTWENMANLFIKALNTV